MWFAILSTGYLGSPHYAAIEFPAGPSVDDDPVGAWTNLFTTIRRAVHDPDVPSHEIDGGPIGRMTIEAAIDLIVTGDLLIHTWDLARATGQNETMRASKPNSLGSWAAICTQQTTSKFN